MICIQNYNDKKKNSFIHIKNCVAGICFVFSSESSITKTLMQRTQKKKKDENQKVNLRSLQS